MTVALAGLVLGVTLLVTGIKGITLKEFLTGEEDPNSPKNKDPFKLPDSFATDTTTGAAAATGDISDAPAALLQLAQTAQDTFHLRVGEFCPKSHCYGKVNFVHVGGSYHYKGEAFDASGSLSDMRAFANYVGDNFPGVTELFWNGAGARNIKNGKPQAAGFVSGHRDHVHVAVAG